MRLSLYTPNVVKLFNYSEKKLPTRFNVKRHLSRFLNH